VAFALTCAGPAAAHSPAPGVEGFYAGLRHPLTTPDQALVLLATGLLLGGFALPRLVPAFVALAAGLAVGLALGHLAPAAPAWLYALAVATGAAAALLPGRGLGAAVALAGVCGLALGWASVPEPGPSFDRAVTMTGSFAGALLLTLYLAGGIDLLRERLDRPAIRIAFRVAAAWITAIANLMLALAQPSS
jgi:hydrogenase/urease accessory protein HupE